MSGLCVGSYYVIQQITDRGVEWFYGPSLVIRELSHEWTNDLGKCMKFFDLESAERCIKELNVQGASVHGRPVMLSTKGL